MDTASLQPLFEYVEINGFQDLWFENTTAKEVERLFLYACTFGAVPVSAAVRGNGAAVIADPTPAGGVLLDQNQDLVDFAYDGVSFDGVNARIEAGAFAVDFDPGHDYWTSERDLIQALEPLGRGV